MTRGAGAVPAAAGGVEAAVPERAVDSLPQQVQHGLDLCMRCAACTATCPTYGVLGHEGFSPRGRVQVAAALLEGRLEPAARSLEFLDTCLHCEACRTACPNGVPVTGLVDLALDLPQLAELRPPRPTSVRLMLWGVQRPWAMALLRGSVWFWQRSGLARLAHRFPWLRGMLGPFSHLEPALPAVPTPLIPPLPPAAAAQGRPGTAATATRGATGSGASAAPEPATTSGSAAPTQPAPTVAFFLGCVQEALFAETNRASLGLLERAGARLVPAPDQTCCGALHAHQGREAEAKRLARQNIAAFERAGADWVVNSAGGCGAMLRDYASLLADEPEWAERARHFAGRVRDISEFLVEQGRVAQPQTEQAGAGQSPGELPERITVQDSCHLSHLQGVRSPLRTLLRPVAGGGLVELPRPDQCCGSAGVYNLEHQELSLAILDRKMADVAATGATLLVTANPGCTLQMRLGVARAGLAGKVRVEHIADVLWESVQGRK